MALHPKEERSGEKGKNSPRKAHGHYMDEVTRREREILVSLSQQLMELWSVKGFFQHNPFLTTEFSVLVALDSKVKATILFSCIDVHFTRKDLVG